MKDILNKLKLEQYGITGITDVIYNPSYEQLYKEEMNPDLEGFEVMVFAPSRSGRRPPQQQREALCRRLYTVPEGIHRFW